MKKIFVDNINDGICTLTGDNHNHLSTVLRARIGDTVVLCQNAVDYECVIEKITKNETVLRIISSEKCESDADIFVTLYFAILKGDKNETVVQKCTELGVKDFRPFVSANCECRPEKLKCERLNKIITEAAQQCGRGTLPKINKISTFAEIVNETDNFDLVVFPYERAVDVPLKEVITGINKGSKIAVIIGSEGGFTKQEAEMLSDKGVKPVTLGKRILRAETASVAVVSAIMYEGDQWKIN